MKTHAQEQGVSYFGSLVTTIAAWSITDWLAVIGFLMGAFTFIHGRIYLIRREKREAQEAVFRENAEKDRKQAEKDRAAQAALDRQLTATRIAVEEARKHDLEECRLMARGYKDPTIPIQGEPHVQKP